MKIIDDDDGQKRLGIRRENEEEVANPTAQAIAKLARAVDGLKAAPPQVLVAPPDTAANEAAMSILKDISDSLHKLTKQVESSRKPKKWTFDVVRNQHGSITSIEAVKE